MSPCGLRVSEPLNLRIKDIDLERRTLCIRSAKGGNQRGSAMKTNFIITQFTKGIFHKLRFCRVSHTQLVVATDRK